MHRSGAKPSPNNDALVAAAFQQHLLRRFESTTTVPGLDHLQRLNRRPPPARRKEVRPVVDSGLDALRAARQRDRPRPLLPPARKERVLPERREQPSLAQRLGLVDGPPPVLTEAQWGRQKAACVARGDPDQPCPICHEEFARHPTLLLSCSHLFHRACLDAFERFSGRKTCPMCRREEYQKRVVFEGEVTFLTRCAVKIQAAWRGFRVRRWYRQYRLRHPPSDPRLRQRWSEDRVAEITDRAVASVEALRVDTFLAEIDASLELSRRVFERWDRRRLGDAEWAALEVRAESRGDADCPICLCALGPGEAGGEGARVLLSCSHVLHARCLDALEQMGAECGLADTDRACPICRSAYSKRYLDPAEPPPQRPERRSRQRASRR